MSPVVLIVTLLRLGLVVTNDHPASALFGTFTRAFQFHGVLSRGLMRIIAIVIHVFVTLLLLVLIMLIVVPIAIIL